MRQGLAIAASAPALALALLAGAPAHAQDSLPSVSDYRLPTARPTIRPQGPVDSDAPVLRAQPPVPAADESPPADAPSPAASATPSAAAAAPGPRAASSSAPPRAALPATPRPAAASAQSAPGAPAAAASAPLPAAGVAGPGAAPGPTGEASASALPGVLDSPGAWRVHSAKESLAERALAIWPWLAGLAFLLGAGLMFLFQQSVMRRRLAALAAHDAEYAPKPQTVAEPPLAADEPAPQPELATQQADAALAEEQSELDLLALLGDSGAPVGNGLAAEQAAAAPSAPRPSLDVLVNPLDVALAARRMSATLLNTVLNYELVVSNNGSEPIGPVQVGGDMIGAHASLPARSQLELAGQSIEPLHRLESLAPGESVTLTGEFRLPLAAITPIRNGGASLFVPLARFRVEALRSNAPPLTINRTFVIGESQERPGAALKPFRLDLGPRLYSRISQREVALSA